MTGVGAGLFIPSVTTAGVTALDASRASLAGGLIYMFQIAGGAIGLGITTAIFTITSENELDDQATAAGSNLTDHQVAVMHGALAGTDSGQAALAQVPGAAHDKIVHRRQRLLRDRHPGRLSLRDRGRGPRLPDLALLRRRPAATAIASRPSSAQA